MLVFLDSPNAKFSLFINSKNCCHCSARNAVLDNTMYRKELLVHLLLPGIQMFLEMWYIQILSFGLEI